MATDPLADDLAHSLRQAVDDWLVAELGRQRRELRALRESVRPGATVADTPAQGGSGPSPAWEQRLTESQRRLDFLASELAQRMDAQGQRMDALHAGLQQRLDQLSVRIDELHGRLGRIGEMAVRRDEHVQLMARHDRLERALEALRERLLNTGVNIGR